jgi:hypothetical protein
LSGIFAINNFLLQSIFLSALLAGIFVGFVSFYFGVCILKRTKILFFGPFY